MSQKASTHQSVVLRIDPGLPCCVTSCRETARVALADFDEDYEEGGRWVLSPVCKHHVIRLSKVYCSAPPPTTGE